MSDSLSSIYGLSVHFTKLPTLRFHCSLPQFQPNFMESMDIGGGGIEPVTFIVNLSNFKNFMAL